MGDSCWMLLKRLASPFVVVLSNQYVMQLRRVPAYLLKRSELLFEGVGWFMGAAVVKVIKGVIFVLYLLICCFPVGSGFSAVRTFYNKMVKDVAEINSEVKNNTLFGSMSMLGSKAEKAGPEAAVEEEKKSAEGIKAAPEAEGIKAAEKKAVIDPKAEKTGPEAAVGEEKKAADVIKGGATEAEGIKEAEMKAATEAAEAIKVAPEAAAEKKAA